MKRFRFTLLVVSLVLLYMGFLDLRVLLSNQQPEDVSIQDLINGAYQQELLYVTGGFMDLEHAISTSGSIEFDALLVPLTVVPGEQPYHVIVETRAPEVLDLVKTYNFKLDSEYQRKQFLEKNREKFYPQRDINGMLFSTIIARANEHKLTKLVQSTGLSIGDPLVLLSEGKEPVVWRGIFYLLMGLLGIVRSYMLFRRKQSGVS